MTEKNSLEFGFPLEVLLPNQQQTNQFVVYIRFFEFAYNYF